MESLAMTVDHIDKLYSLATDIAQIKTTVGFIQEQQKEIKDDMRGFMAKLEKIEGMQSDMKATLAKYSVGFALVFSVIGAIVKHFLGI